MFLIPLGLEVKSWRFPIATVSILVVTVLFSVLHIHDSDDSTIEMLTSPATRALFQARAELAIESCSQVEILSTSCELIKNEFKASESQFPLSRQQKMAAALSQKFKRGDTENLEQMMETLFQDQYWLKNSARLESLSTYPTYREAHDFARQELLERQRSQHILSKSNFNLRSLFEAQIRHAGWMHLFGNMVFFIMLAIPVEERLGPLIFAGLYFLCGFVGLSAQIYAFKDDTLALVGASAAIMGVAGIFLVLFWKFSMRAWLSLAMVWNKVISIPTRLFIPVFIISGDLTGVLLPGSHVAHLAHLGGLAMGAIGALLVLQLDPLPEGFAFPFERQFIEDAGKANDPLKRLGLIYSVLFHHKNNRVAQDLFLAETLERPWAELAPSVQVAIADVLGAIFERKQSDGSASFVEFVSAFRSDWPIEELPLTGLNLDLLLQELSSLEKQEQPPAVYLRLLKIVRRLVREPRALAEIDRRLAQFTIHQEQMHAAS